MLTQMNMFWPVSENLSDYNIKICVYQCEIYFFTCQTSKNPGSIDCKDDVQTDRHLTD